jgi:DNA/RNA endonuclease YhcR with UshA esterase domain
MLIRCLFGLVAFATSVTLAGAADEKPLTPVEARKKVGSKITVQMEVKAAKDRLEKRGEIYLDAEENFKDEKNFAVVISKKGAASLKEAGITDPADHFKGKVIQATGTVTEVDGIPRIEIDKSEQVKLAEKKP